MIKSSKTTLSTVEVANIAIDWIQENKGSQPYYIHNIRYDGCLCVTTKFPEWDHCHSWNFSPNDSVDKVPYDAIVWWHGTDDESAEIEQLTKELLKRINIREQEKIKEQQQLVLEWNELSAHFMGN